MESNLFEPTIVSNKFSTKSYSLNSFFLIALIGGLIPVLILSVKNMKWLKVADKWIYLYVVLWSVIFGAWIFAIKTYTPGSGGGAHLTVKSIIRLLSLLAYIIAYLIMRNNYKKHCVYVEIYEPVMKDAITYSLVGMVISFIIIYTLLGNYLT